ncbi:MAG: hypothetical protein FJX47_02555 [Alphaproteobacteria bacterium]|nr:hypothetical protein [Alphaproteobacteria bacterium]
MAIDSILIYLIASIIGIPVAAFFMARFYTSYKRETTMFEWSAQEVKRRGEALSEAEKKSKSVVLEVQKLKSEVAQLTEELEKYKKKFGDLSGKPAQAGAPGAPAPGKPGAPGAPPGAGLKKFEIGIFNQLVRDALAEGRKLREYSDAWAEQNFVAVEAKSEADARAMIEKRYPVAKGFVVTAVTEQKYG